MELCSMLCGSLNRKVVWGRMDTCIYMAKSFCCPPETCNIVNCCTPIKNIKFKIDYYRYKLSSVNLMVTTMHKPIADTEEIRKKSKHRTREHYQITKRTKGERNKEITK